MLELLELLTQYHFILVAHEKNGNASYHLTKRGHYLLSKTLSK
ncbi:hypothetical protein X560_2353 [Listeria fleischmannii 1991]|uniref:Uncharacterized protein n=1 Tax=Listeria fleischmannii 1991 TaxID=1430899 RepID=A0A0J8G7E9_9LIST|nr:hypothetical protein X560_2353 [Listeria fleischmannii 1991]